MAVPGGVEALFELAPTPIGAGDQVDVTMLWGEVRRCAVLAVKSENGWPVAELQHQGQTPFTVDLARCRRVS